MPHYLIQGSYSAEGCEGLIAEGATARLEEASSLITALGGTMESMYYVWGTDDVVGICEMPDDAAAAAASLAVSSSGKVGVRITPLIPAGDIDVAAAKAREVTYRAPGT
ncbi:MAG: GYD domain-containing protein [Actinomycetota bacterium]|nr:GYD domain-containing protein [Actinomycetota bacterium]MED5393777.1 GYD domain-containing protein [Actinomycetota bacterium]MEE3353254.1 GYD domain-containing protein [Actinomycetota bacterium]